MSTIHINKQLTTELRQASRELVASELSRSLERRAMDFASNGIIITDHLQPDEPIIYANKAFCELSGYGLDELIGKNCRLIQATGSSPRELGKLRSAIAAGEAVRVVLRNRRKDGHEFWNNVSISPVPGPDGTITHFIGTQLDVSDVVENRDELEETIADRTASLSQLNKVLQKEIEDKREIERALIHQQKLLEASNYDLDQFATVASHDLQEPLRMIVSFLGLVDKRYHDRLDDDGRQFIAYAVDGGNRMKLLINDLLAYARLGADDKPFVSVRLDHALMQAMDNLRLQISEADATVTHDALPIIDGDEVLLTVLLQNLISNALTYRSIKAPRIGLTSVIQDDQAIITVTDNGRGFEQKYAERIFMMFRQLEKQTGSGNSRGIGLTTSRRIVAKHGGTITASSRPGHGSNFKIILPLHHKGYAK